MSLVLRRHPLAQRPGARQQANSTTWLDVRRDGARSNVRIVPPKTARSSVLRGSPKARSFLSIPLACRFCSIMVGKGMRLAYSFREEER